MPVTKQRCFFAYIFVVSFSNEHINSFGPTEPLFHAYLLLLFVLKPADKTIRQKTQILSSIDQRFPSSLYSRCQRTDYFKQQLKQTCTQIIMLVRVLTESAAFVVVTGQERCRRSEEEPPVLLVR